MLLKNDISQVPLLADFINQVCDKFALDSNLSFQLNLVLEEAVVNVIQYAYPDGGEHTFTLDADMEADTVTFVLRDDGKPFNRETQNRWIGYFPCSAYDGRSGLSAYS